MIHIQESALKQKDQDIKTICFDTQLEYYSFSNIVLFYVFCFQKTQHNVTK